MPIDFSKKIIFIHVPKTGGSTISSRLKIPDGMHTLSRSRLRISVDGCFYTDDHIPAWIVKRLRPEEFKEYYKFSFVRNPYDRIYSEFVWYHSDRLSRINPQVSENPRNIENWNFDNKPMDESIIKKQFDIWVRNYYSPIDNGRKHSQVFHLFDKQKTKILIDGVYKFENFEYEFEKLCKKINFTPDSNEILTKSKVSIDRNILLTENNKDYIYTLFKEDFDTFGYSKEYHWNGPTK